MRDVKEYIKSVEGNLVVIDGSLIAFVASSAGEKRDIEVTQRDTGKKKVFDNITAFKKSLKIKNAKREDKGKETFEISDFDIENRQHPQEVEVTLHILKEMVKSIQGLCDADDCLIVLDDPAPTFRHKLATVQKYKGNRDGKAKPVNLQAVKDHMILYYNTEVAPKGIEADDVLNFYAYEGSKLTKKGDPRKIIAVTFDKDQNGNPGWVFDFRKDKDGSPMMREPEFISGLGDLRVVGKGIKGKGKKFFYYQWLGQDSADNYKASKLFCIQQKKRFGDKSTFKLLDGCKTSKECFQTVINQFKEWYPEPVKYVSWDGKDVERNWLEISQEYFDLARMRRWEDDEVLVEDLLEKMGIVVEEEV